MMRPKVRDEMGKLYVKKGESITPGRLILRIINKGIFFFQRDQGRGLMLGHLGALFWES